VRGVSQVGWLRAKLNRDSYKVPSATKDLGTLGSTREIAETDLLERLKENLGKIDWKALQQQFRHRFWEQVSFQNLPETRETREYWIDLSVTAPHDLRGPTGQRLILSGQRVNPLEIMPFRQRLLVFDATRPGQVETVQRLAREAGNRRVVLMATQIDRTKGWDGFAGLENRLQSPVYLLTPELKERFRLKAVPALIEADQFRIRVREIKPKVPA
jgi:conjugal transfer pilus assembly protein TraW